MTQETQKKKKRKPKVKYPSLDVGEYIIGADGVCFSLYKKTDDEEKKPQILAYCHTIGSIIKFIGKKESYKSLQDINHMVDKYNELANEIDNLVQFELDIREKRKHHEKPKNVNKSERR